MKTANHKKWLDALTMELRLNNVSGKSIGDTLAAVQEFLADSGQAPEDAFGTPREYAAALAAEGMAAPPEKLQGSLALSTTSLVVFLIFTSALTPWINGEPLLLGGAQVACMLVLAAMALTLPLYLAHLLRNTWALVAVPVVGGAAGVLSAVLAPRDAGEALLALAPGELLLASAALLVALSVIGTLFALRTPADAIAGPLDAAPRPRFRWFELLTQWLFPILAVVMLGLTALIGAIA
ncbi:hypothetical protein [Arthrobacter sp. HY1533]|uniref:hypothetical protein n=1 Tax=Arthrobacter sp. HY1533 TaxID=2970919 RepID=UPI0022B9E678|nr:hypothetical protein [Arthrobacter sp. HY1533]